MKRYGQRVITLKDMLVEYLMAHMEGASFKQLKEELGASEFGLRKLIAKMRSAGELNQVKKSLPATQYAVVNEYIRVRMREGGFRRRIIPPVQITDDELDYQVDTDKPVKVIDKEPQSPGAIPVQFDAAYPDIGAWAPNLVFKLSPRMWIEEAAGI